MLVRRTCMVIVFIALLAAGCTAAEPGTSDSPDTSPTVSGSTMSPRPEPSVVDVSPAPTASAGAQDERLAEPGALLSASDRGVDVVSSDGSVTPLTSIPAQRAYDDGAGGVVFQGIAPPQPEAPSPAIMWLPPDGSDAVTVVPDGEADFVRLYDAAVVDGRPSAIYTVLTDSNQPTDAEQQLVVQALPDGEPRTIAKVGGFESGANAISYGQELFALSQFAEASGWSQFLDVDGAAVDVEANPVPESDPCFDSPGCPPLIALSASGDRLAYLEGNSVRIVSLGEDAERSVPLRQEDGVLVDALELSGETLVVNRSRLPEGSGPDGPQQIASLVYDLSASNPEPVEYDRPAYLSVAAP